MLTVPRLFDKEYLNRRLQTISVTLQPEHQLLLLINKPLALVVERPGLLDSLYFINDNIILISLAADELYLIITRVRLLLLRFRITRKDSLKKIKKI